MNKPVAWYDSEEYGSIRWASEWAVDDGASPLRHSSLCQICGKGNQINISITGIGQVETSTYDAETSSTGYDDVQDAEIIEDDE